MGLLKISVFTMKIFFALAALLTISTSSAKWPCEDWTAVVNSMAAYLTSEESVGKQIDIPLADVCPQVENPKGCVEGLPDFWAQIAQVLWPGYYNAEADWMCAPLCSGAEVRDISCEDCFQGIQKGIDQLLQPETIQAIVDALSGEWFCDAEEDPERCAGVIEVSIPLALPALAANPDQEAGATICNNAIPDLCM